MDAEGLHRLLANCYQFTISERSIQNLEAAMADSDNPDQFMQATYVRFKPDARNATISATPSGARIIWNRLFRKRSSASLLKNAGKYGLTFSKHIEGSIAASGVCKSHPRFAAT